MKKKYWFTFEQEQFLFRLLETVFILAVVFGLLWFYSWVDQNM